MRETIEIAKEVLKNNRRSGYTLPTNNELYPAQWNCCLLYTSDAADE